MPRVVLYQPQIPPNTGNVARTCAATGCELHLIEPLGFTISDRHLRRAGLDYWPWVSLHRHGDLERFQAERRRRGGRLVALSSQAEAVRLAAFEREWQGIEREQDYVFFLRNEIGAWRVWMLEDARGALEGFIVASHHPSCVMLGPGVARDEAVSAALLWRALDAMRGLSPVFLVPNAAAQLVRTCYGWGARNLELHAAQTLGPVAAASGIAFPTFLPETG